MGMSYTGFGAPVTVKNLKVNADLNLGSYDLTATDVKGDTAEFDEFVGGVGNFTNVLGSGNLDIEGTGNVKGLTTFQNGVQVNGSLHVEGSINNVNIADNGEITTSQGVNGADFNGAKITSTKFNGATINTSGDYSGRKGTFSGAVSGTTGTFTGNISAPNISNRNLWVLLLTDTPSNLSNYPINIGVLGSVNTGGYGSADLNFNNTTINAGGSISRLVCYNKNDDRYGITPIVDIRVIGGSWSYKARTTADNITATFNNKTITNSGVTLTLSEVKSILTTPFTSTIRNNGTNAITQYGIQVVFNNTSSSYQYGYIVPLDLIT